MTIGERKAGSFDVFTTSEIKRTGVEGEGK
jgi:hypothetical protein